MTLYHHDPYLVDIYIYNPLCTLLEALESDDLGQQIWAECDEMGGMCHRLSASWLGHKLTLLKSKKQRTQ